VAFNNLKVTQISTTTKGGAGIAARSLNQNLQQSGIDSNFLSLEQMEFREEIGELGVVRSSTQRFISGALGEIHRRISRRSFFSLYSYSPESVRLSVERYSEERILHIHNWFNFTNLRQLNFLSESGATLVATLHDERFYTGGCHSTLGCTNFMESCKPCPELKTGISGIPHINLLKSERQYSKFFRNTHFIAPSKWIFEQAQNSRLLADSKISFIPNVISAPTNVNRVPRISGLIRLGFAAVDPKSYVKGGDFYRSAVEFSSLHPEKLQILELKDFDKSKKDFWGNIDFLCVPSKADNSPNVIHEAKQLGIPILGARVGGIPEMLNPRFDILIDDDVKDFSFYTAQMERSSLALMKSTNSEWAFSQFSEYLGDGVKKHIELYENL
jgi:glycosyltransferase involved in cell wall biosynthesis